MSKLFNRFASVIGVILFVAASMLAQSTSRTGSLPRTVRGQVRLAHGGAPAQHVMVRLERFHGGVWTEVVTDTTGKYEFSGMPPDLYVITIHLSGYLDQRRDIDLESTNNAIELFQLVPVKSSPENAVPSNRVIDAKVPSEASHELAKGETILANGAGPTEIDEAARHFENAVKIYPAYLQGYLRLGASYMDLKQWDKAESALKRAIQIDSHTANAWFALGEVYLQQKRLDEGETVLRQGLAIENRSWRGHFTLGRLYLEKRETVQAAKQIALTLQLNPDLAEAHLLAGNIFLNAGKRQDALDQYQEYLRLAPNGAYSNQVRDILKKLKR